jgi:hypothetical protein
MAFCASHCLVSACTSKKDGVITAGRIEFCAGKLTRQYPEQKVQSSGHRLQSADQAAR